MPNSPTPSAERQKRFVIACYSLNGAFKLNHTISNIVSEKLVHGYEVILQPIVQPKNLKGNMYDSMFIEEAWNKELDSFSKVSNA